LDGRVHPLDSICGGRSPIQDEGYSFTGFGGYDSLPPRYAAVRTVNGGQHEWGLIDTSLTYRRLPDDVFTAATVARPCAEHVVLIQTASLGLESVCGLFNLGDMRLELPAIYSSIIPSSGSTWVVCRTTGEHREILHYAFYDVSKRELLPGWFTFALPFSCGLGAIRVGEWETGGRSYFVREDLRPAFDAEFDRVEGFSHGLAAVQKGDDTGYVDTAGRMRLLLTYEDLQPFNRFGLALANRDAKYCDIDIIDHRGGRGSAGWKRPCPGTATSRISRSRRTEENLSATRISASSSN
jgi:hypothetical protein